MSCNSKNCTFVEKAISPVLTYFITYILHKMNELKYKTFDMPSLSRSLKLRQNIKKKIASDINFCKSNAIELRYTDQFSCFSPFVKFFVPIALKIETFSSMIKYHHLISFEKVLNSGVIND